MQPRIRSGGHLPRLIGAVALAASATAAPAQTRQGQDQTGQGQAGPVPAPPAADAGDAPFGNIIVTARRRAESAQSVPISIDTFDQRAVERLDLRTLEDLRFSAPSVYIAPSTFRQDTLNITIRGQQNFPSTGLQFDTSAAVYMDGVYLARPVGLTGSLFDIDEIEVLKGPQGTLVGRNSTGGAILYETRQPVRDFGGYLRGTIGDYGRREVQGALNVPLTDTLWARAALSLSRQQGYISNHYLDPATGFANTTPAMGYRRLAGLFSLKWEPSSDFSLLLRGNFSDEDYTGTTYHSLGAFTGTVNAAGGRPSICNIPGTCTGFTDLPGHVITPYYVDYRTGTAVSTVPTAYNALLNSVAREQRYGFWSTEQAISNRDEGHFQTVSGVADQKVGTLDVRLLGAYRWFDTSGSSQNRGLPYVTNVYNYRTPAYRSYQAELTLNGAALHDRLKYTAGLFYFRETSPTDGDQLWLFLPSGGSPAAAPGRQITYTDQTRNGGANTSYAAYGQATFSLLPHTRLTAGARYTIDRRSALLETRTLRFPATAATTATVPNGVYDPGSYILLGTTYSGLTRACGLTNANGVLLPLAQCSVPLSRTFRKPTWTLALEQDLFDRTLVYATARSGYRSGAINSQAVNPIVSVAAPERVRDYEIGLKSDWRIGRLPLRTNLALFLSDYRDIQIQTTLPNVTIASAPAAVGGACTQAVYNAGQCTGVSNDAVTLNARRANIKGAEFSVTTRPLRGLTLDGSGSYLHAYYTDYRFDPPPGYLLPSGQVDLSGTPFPLPRWQLNGNAVYDLPVKTVLGLRFDGIQVSYHIYYQGRFQADLRPYNLVQRTSAYALSDARLSLRGIGGTRIDASLFVKNLFDKQACQPEPQGVLNSAPNATFGVAGTSGVLQCLPLPPRMFGGTVGFSF